MDTVYKLSVYCEEHNIDDIKVMGAPKTIDNDLGETDIALDLVLQPNLSRLRLPRLRVIALFMMSHP